MRYWQLGFAVLMCGNALNFVSFGEETMRPGKQDLGVCCGEAGLSRGGGVIQTSDWGLPGVPTTTPLTSTPL